MSGIQYRRSRGANYRSKVLELYIVTLKVRLTSEQITYNVLAFSEPLANIKALEKAQKDGYSLKEIEFVEIS